MLNWKAFEKRVNSLAFSPDGTRVLACGAEEGIKLFDAFTGQERWHRDGEKRDHWHGQFTPDGRRLLTVGDAAGVQLWDATAWEPAETFNWKAGKLTTVAVSPDGTRAAVGSESGKVVVFDI